MRWLEAARVDDEPLGLADAVLAGFLRVVTHPRVFRTPSPIDVALAFCEALRAAPAALRVVPGELHWTLLAGLCRTCRAAGNAVPDLAIAALALEHRAAVVSFDRAFGGVAGLRWELPG